MSDNINIVIPMAGEGKRFKEEGYTEPKPFIDVLGKPMVEQVIGNFTMNGKYILIVQKHLKRRIELLTKRMAINAKVISIDYITEGPASTCMLAEKLINNDNPLFIINCDQIVEDWNPKVFLDFCRTKNPGGVLGTFYSTSHKNSYAKLNSEHEVIKTKEKVVISNLALNGFHYWKKGTYFVDSFKEMKREHDTVHGEYYVAPSYNYLIKNLEKILTFHFNMHFPIGTPEDLEYYIRYKRGK